MKKIVVLISIVVMLMVSMTTHAIETEQKQDTKSIVVTDSVVTSDLADFSYETHGRMVKFKPHFPYKNDYFCWYFGDRTKKCTPDKTITHNYARYGDYQVTLKARNNWGHWGKRTYIVHVNPPRPRPPERVTNEQPFQVFIFLKDLNPEGKMLVMGSVLILSGLALVIASASGG